MPSNTLLLPTIIATSARGWPNSARTTGGNSRTSLMRPCPLSAGLDAALLVVGLAPGLKGANFSGRPFTGDYAGDLLYPTLLKFGFARGAYDARPDDGLELVNARITNAVRCVPPQNKRQARRRKPAARFWSMRLRRCRT